MSAILDEYHKLVTVLESEGHALAGKFRAIFDHLRGEATTDAQTVAHDAQAAMGPVLAEAERDFSTLGAEAAADAATATATIGVDAKDFAEKLGQAKTDPAPPASA